jgi:hypothetical protein
MPKKGNILTSMKFPSFYKSLNFIEFSKRKKVGIYIAHSFDGLVIRTSTRLPINPNQREG